MLLLIFHSVDFSPAPDFTAVITDTMVIMVGMAVTRAQALAFLAWLAAKRCVKMDLTACAPLNVLVHHTLMPLGAMVTAIR
jgi:hypothetical protein